MGRDKPLNTGRNQVNINIPMGLVNVGIKMGAWFAPEIEGERLEGILDAVRSSQLGTVMDITDEEDGERVQKPSPRPRPWPLTWC
ncbi:MAG: hypothetical protein KBD86_05245 [Candidatus Promineofilum sp.]|nr:hypothetical protein [Promineifilum sp.]